MPTIEELSEIVASGDFDRFVGLEEDEYFDAKGPRPYDLGSPTGRYELAKDVSAFANSAGGYLVVGLSHAQDPERNVDRVKALQLVREDEFQATTMLGIIRTLVHPGIVGLSATWVRQARASDEGLGIVCIPPQPDEGKPFLIADVLVDDVQLKQIVFGMARRIDSSAMPLTIDELRRSIKEGSSPVAVRLTTMNEKLDALLGRMRQPRSREASLGDRLDEVAKDGE